MMAQVDAVALEVAILDAHDRQDVEALASLYQRAAGLKQATNDIDAYWFLMTHAYVFALECGHPDVEQLHAALKAGGRDE